VVGIAGQIGSGAAEVVRALAGLIPVAEGRLSLRGRGLPIRSRAAMRDAGIAFISEDRASEGLFLKRPIRENLVASSLAGLCSGGYLSLKRLDARAAAVAKEVGVDPKRLLHHACTLSGGNQQKLAFGRCLAPEGRAVPSLILMNEPTRGVDIGARSDLYKIMRELCSRNFGLLMHTTDLEEMIGIADVILTMYRGRLVKVYSSDQATLPTLVADITHSEAGSPVLEESK
jgi:ABC-type sugar transport system ATPase subunit